MFEINNEGVNRNKFVQKESLRLFIVGTFIYGIAIVILYLSMLKWILFFYIMLPLTIFYEVFLFVHTPLLMLKRHNRTVEEMYIEEEQITLKTFPALWMKSKETIIDRSQSKIIKTVFVWYGKEQKDGFILKSGKNEYYLVLDYFDEKEDLLVNLK